MVNHFKEGLALLVKSAVEHLKSEDTTEEPEETNKPEPPQDPKSKPMLAYWETDIKQLGARNQYYIDLFNERKDLERIPETTERPIKEFHYKYGPVYEYANINGAPEPPKSGTEISSSGHDAGVVAGIVIAVISGIIILAGLIAVVMYKHYVHRNVTSMNFDNPVYRKTTEDQFALEKNGYAPGSKLYPSTVGEEAQEPLNTPGTNDFV